MDLIITSIFIAVFCVFNAPTHGLIGYDCNASNMDTTASFSLSNSLSDCKMDHLEEKQVYIRLLELNNKFDSDILNNKFDTNVIQCKVEIDRKISSYKNFQNNGTLYTIDDRKNYIYTMTEGTCNYLQEVGVLKIGQNYIPNFKVNSTKTHKNIILTGCLSSSCSGTESDFTFSDPYGNWNNVTVTATIKVTVRNFQAPIHYLTNEIILPSGLKCPASKGECLDIDGTGTYWSVIPRENNYDCHFDKYSLLYEGIATRLTSKIVQLSNAPLTTYIMTMKNTTTFAVAIKSQYRVFKCEHLSKITNLFYTDHPKLLIFESEYLENAYVNNSLRKSDVFLRGNLDAFLHNHVNSDFIYVEKHLESQPIQIYKNIVDEKCSINRRILVNNSMKTKPGYTTIIENDIIYLKKCIPVECRIRQTEECYKELPVTHSNISYFLELESRTLRINGTKIDCKYYKIWLRNFTNYPKSRTMRSLPGWEYKGISNLANAGIYSQEDLDRFWREHVIGPTRPPMTLATMTYPSSNLWDSLWTTNAGICLWGKGFVTFSSVGAAIFAIIMPAFILA